MTINDAQMKQNKFHSMVDALNNYYPRAQNYIKSKNSLLNNAKNVYKGREKIIEGFEQEIFLYKGDVFKTKEEESEDKSEKESEEEKIEKFIKYIENESKNINYDLFKKYFKFVVPSILIKEWYKIKNRKKYNELVNVI